MGLTSRHRLVLAVGVLIVGAGLRLWRIAQVPPGLHRDEAFHLLRAQEIARGEAFPVYITGNNGNEPLFAYSAALTLSLLGPVSWAGRLAAAWIGLVGVAATLRTGAEMFPKQRVGISAGLILAVLYYHLNFSRFGSQPIWAATAAAGTMAALWRGVRTGSYWAYGLAGLCLGLGLNSYLAFRLFPIAPLVSGLALLIAQRRGRRSLLGGGVVTGGVTLLIYAPLGLFFIRHPTWFFQRFGQTTEVTLDLAQAGAALLENTLKVLGGLFFQGDSNWRHNIPGRPALDLAQFLFLLIGTGYSSRQWQRPEATSLLIWLAIGLLPSILTDEAPHFGRMTMAAPAIALLAGWGMHVAWQCTRSSIARGLIMIAIGSSVSLTASDYFERWAWADDLFAAFDGRQVWIARALLTAPPRSALYATPLEGDLWTLEYLLGREAFGRLAVFNGEHCLIVPAVTQRITQYAVIGAEDQHTLPALEAVFPSGTHLASVAREGRPYLDGYQISPGQVAQVASQISRQANFSEIVRMIGYSRTGTYLKPGGQIQLTVVWHIQQRAQSTYKIFVHLIGAPKDDGSIIYTQRDIEPCNNSYSTRRWSPGELVVEAYPLTLPEDLPPGKYTLQIGWYDGATGERLLVFDDRGQSIGDALKLEQMSIAAP